MESQEVQKVLAMHTKGLSALRLRLLRALIEARPAYVIYFDLKMAMYGQADHVNVQMVALQKYFVSAWLEDVGQTGVDLGHIENFPSVGYALMGGNDEHIEIFYEKIMYMLGQIPHQ